jgi:predicted metal-dependent hydrolase
MGVEVKRLEEIMSKWKNILRLNDWDLQLKIVEKEWRKSGDIKIDTSNRNAVMLINNNPKCTNLEELVVHELLHLKLWGMDQMIEELINQIFGENEDDKKREFAMNQFFGILEPTVEDLAKAFLKANGCEEELSFGILNKLIDDEIGSN